VPAAQAVQLAALLWSAAVRPLVTCPLGQGLHWEAPAFDHDAVGQTVHTPLLE